MMGKLRIVDLAGSEKFSRMGVSSGKDHTNLEVSSINKSLSTLG